jgi:zona occludens toxin (predicted ATPase)
VCTLFIGSFWATCYKNRWIASKKIIDDKQLTFDGKALQYFGKKIVWLLLTIITVFIYSFWLKVKTKNWIVSHTKIAVPKNDETDTADNSATTTNAADNSAAANNQNTFAILGLVFAFLTRFLL